MKKVKVVKFTGMKKCKDGEIYRFKNGKAKVPGIRMSQPVFQGLTKFMKPVYITYQEFLRLNK